MEKLKLQFVLLSLAFQDEVNELQMYARNYRMLWPKSHATQIPQKSRPNDLKLCGRGNYLTRNTSLLSPLHFFVPLRN